MLASYPLKNGSSPVLATDSGAPSSAARTGAAAATSSSSADASAASGEAASWAAASAPPRTRSSPRRCSRTPGRRPAGIVSFSVKFQILDLEAQNFKKMDAIETWVGVTSSLRGQLLGSEVAEEERDGLLAVDLEPVGADQVLLVEDGVVRAQEAEILKLKTKREEEIH